MVMEIPDSIKKLMNENPELKVFIELLLGKIQQLEQKIDKKEKESLPFFKSNIRRRHKKSGRKNGHEGTSSIFQRKYTKRRR